MLERSEGSLESLFENDEVYNTFLLLGEDREAALNYLYDLYNIKSKEKPLSIKDQLKELAQLSDPLLLYLVVEIQLVRKENGCFKFEKREPGCIEAEFQAFAEASKMILEASSNQLKELGDEDAFLPASHSLFQILHKIMTDTKKVKMETVKAETSGKYRSNNEECLVLPTNEVSDGGVAHLIELIQNKKIQTMMLCGNKDYKNYQNLINKSRILKELADIFQAIQKIEGADENTILGSINALHHKAYTKEQLNQYFKYFLIVVMIKNQLRSKLDQSVELKDRAIIETALKELALGDDFHTVIALIRKNAENSVFQSVIHSFTSELLMKAEEMTSDAAEQKKYLVCLDCLDKNKLAFNATDMATLAKELMIHIEGTDQEFLIQFPDVAEMNDLLTETIRQFHLGAKGILNKSLDERYTFLYEHLQLFLLIHPFIDANNRVFLNTLTPLWHIMLKLPDMPLFYNPFVFYGHTIPEIVATAKLSTANMMAIKEYSNMRKSSYFNFLDQTLTEDQLTLLAQWVMPFRKLMNKVLLQEWIDVIEKNITSKLSAPASVSPTVLFGPISPEQIALGNDLAQMKKCQGVSELSQFLETKAQEYQSIHSRIANLYNGILAEMKVKNQKNVKPF